MFSQIRGCINQKTGEEQNKTNNLDSCPVTAYYGFIFSGAMVEEKSAKTKGVHTGEVVELINTSTAKGISSNVDEHGNQRKPKLINTIK